LIVPKKGNYWEEVYGEDSSGRTNPLPTECHGSRYRFATARFRIITTEICGAQITVGRNRM
jgi:hypothetical protein